MPTRTAAFPHAERRSGQLRWLPVRLAFVALAAIAALAGAGPPAGAQSATPAEDLHVGPVAILSQVPTLLDLGAGTYDLIGNAHRNETGAAGAELRLGQRWGGVGPAVGTLVDVRGGGMAYVGIDSDFAVGPVIVTPLAGLGAWWHGSRDDERLGGTFEFRLSLAAAYAFADGARAGLRFGHISNADIHTVNPGENDLMLTYAFPLGL